MSFRHIVLFRIRAEVSDEQVDAAIDALAALRALPGVAAMRVTRSLDERKGRIIVEDATFIDQAAFTAFRAAPAHVAAAEQLSRIADWWVGDYLA